MTPQISEMIPHSSTFWLVAPDFTTQNMRNALPSPYPWIRARYLLSSDKVLGAGDTQIYEANLVGGASAWEVRRHRPVIAINPQTALPVAGVQRCILVQLDPLNYHSEANEADNVLDTKFCYTREM